MAKDEDLRPITVGLEQPTEPNYEAMSLDEVLEAIGQAYKAKDMKLMGRLSKLHTHKEADEAKTKKDALLAALVAVTASTLKDFTDLADRLVDTGVLDGAEGVWFALDLGEVRQQGVNPSLRLVQRKRQPSEPGSSSGTSSYIASPEKSGDMLARVGTQVLFTEDTVRTIDKQEHTMPAGMTLQKAYDYSTNGGWRNFVRMALLKADGKVGKV